MYYTTNQLNSKNLFKPCLSPRPEPILGGIVCVIVKVRCSRFGFGWGHGPVSSLQHLVNLWNFIDKLITNI